MWRAAEKTSVHLNTEMSRNRNRIRYPKMAPPREEKISSPVPMVSEAMIAPGPNTVSQRKGLLEASELGSVGNASVPVRTALVTAFSFYAEAGETRTFRTRLGNRVWARRHITPIV